MGLGIWFEEDIRNVLLAADEASVATAAMIAETIAIADVDDLLVTNLQAYREGYRAALATVALAFGLSPAALWPPASDDSDRAEL